MKKNWILLAAFFAWGCTSASVRPTPYATHQFDPRQGYIGTSFMAPPVLGNATQLAVSPAGYSGLTNTQSLGSWGRVKTTHQESAGDVTGSLGHSIVQGLSHTSYYSPLRGYLGSELSRGTGIGSFSSGYAPRKGPYFNTPWNSLNQLVELADKRQ